MRENEGMSYDTAWTTANALPELAQVVEAMKRPVALERSSVAEAALLEMARQLVNKHDSTANATPRTPCTAEERNAVIQTAISQHMGAGKTYDDAWQIVKKHPETKALFDAMKNPQT